MHSRPDSTPAHQIAAGEGTSPASTLVIIRVPCALPSCTSFRLYLSIAYDMGHICASITAWFNGLVVMISVLHTEGPEFDPQLNHKFFISLLTSSIFPLDHILTRPLLKIRQACMCAEVPLPVSRLSDQKIFVPNELRYTIYFTRVYLKPHRPPL